MPLDPQVKAMLDAARAMGLPPLHECSVAEARERAVNMRPRDAIPAPVAKVTDVAIAGPGGDLPLRIYTPGGAGPFPILVYYHGGGYVVCNLDTHDQLCHELCHESGAMIVSVDYRLAPEHKFPAATDDCLAAARWAGEHIGDFNGDAGRIALGGDSCGGALAAVTNIRVRDEGGPAVRGQLLVYPITDYYDPPTQSYIDNADGYFLTRDGMKWFYDHYLNNSAEARHPHVAPLRCPDLGGLAPAYVITAEFDPLRDEGDQYARRLSEAGVNTVHKPYPGMIHGFYSQIGILDRSAEAIADSCAWLKSVFHSRS